MNRILKKGGERMCNCMNRGCSVSSNQLSVKCGNLCFSSGPLRATSTVCPPENIGSIIPFSSGTGLVTVTFTPPELGEVRGVSAIGFGSAVDTIAIGNTVILPTEVAGTTEAFSVPRVGTNTAISATFTETAIADVTGTAIITAQVYRAPAGIITFTATNAFVNLTPVLTGTINVGTTFQGLANLSNIPVSAGDRLAMVFSVSGTGVTDIIVLTGAATAGITIS
ncbi:exosporium glycoprotein BclB-related protein [Solibacillus sp. FSL W7-1436]|uniref:exosporium glycoprotein BclB-related protein n=2 Tax=Solibacillus TaxID=648800 RepID=UPI0030F8D20F